MKNRVLVVLGSVVGSFAVYCACSVHADSSAPSGANSEAGAGGFVNPAHAEGATASCCAPPAPKFKKIASGNFTKSAASAIIPVGGFREVVVYLTANGLCSGPQGYTYRDEIAAQFRPDANTPFGETGQRFKGVTGRLRVDGADLQLTLPGGYEPAQGYTCTETSYVVAGVE
jgi:hypothetical protein